MKIASQPSLKTDLILAFSSAFMVSACGSFQSVKVASPSVSVADHSDSSDQVSAPTNRQLLQQPIEPLTSSAHVENESQTPDEANPAPVAPVTSETPQEASSQQSGTSIKPLPTPVEQAAAPVTEVTSSADSKQPKGAEPPYRPPQHPASHPQSTVPARASEAPSSSRAASSDALEILTLVNQARQAAGLNVISYDPLLSLIAQDFARDMRARNYFSHVGPNGETERDRMQAHSAPYGFAGENIAVGQKSAAEVFQAWMNSPDHRENILGAKFRKLGTGSSGDYWVQEFSD